MLIVYSLQDTFWRTNWNDLLFSLSIFVTLSILLLINAKPPPYWPILCDVSILRLPLLSEVQLIHTLSISLSVNQVSVNKHKSILLSQTYWCKIMSLFLTDCTFIVLSFIVLWFTQFLGISSVLILIKLLWLADLCWFMFLLILPT